MNDAHGQPNHINLLVLDTDSDITGHGQHNRLLVFGSTDHRTVTVREDFLHDLPTPAQRLHVANGWQRQHPKGTHLQHVESTAPYPSLHSGWLSVDHVYAVHGAK